MRALAPLLAATALVLAWPARAADPPLGCPASFERQVVELVNQERAAEDLPPLAIDVRLMEAAQLHSDDMAENDFHSHTGSNGSDPVERIEDAGYLPWLSLGENVAAGFATPAAVVAAWMASPSHRDNILSELHEDIGVGYAFDASAFYDHYWTQDFGSSTITLEAPLDFCPRCSNALDDDGDGLIDFPDDGYCSSPTGTLERPRRSCGLGAELALVLPLLRALRRRRGRWLRN